jgi:TonB-dependent siderophore receptor
MGSNTRSNKHRDWTPAAVGGRILGVLSPILVMQVCSAALATDVAQSGQAPSSQGSGIDQIQELVVTAKRYEFLNVDTSGTTNLPLAIELVPQSISLVSNDFIEAADLKTLGEIAEYTPGALNVGAAENFSSGIFLRGFPVIEPAIDGLPLIGGYIEPDNAIYDRLEIVKGPSSVVYGVSNPGGLNNYVTKSATGQTTSYVSAQVGNWEGYRVEAQLAGVLDPGGHLRGIAVGVRDQGNSFVDQMFHERTTAYGGLDFDFDPVTGYVHGGYERQKVPSFDGVPEFLDGSPPPVRRSFFVGSRDVTENTDMYHAESNLTWQATNDLQFSLKGAYQNIHLVGGEDYAYGLEPDGTITIGGDTFQNPGDRNESYAMGGSSIYRFDSLGLKGSFLSVGVLYQHYTGTLNSLTTPPPYVTSDNIFNGEASIAQAINALLATANVPSYQRTESSALTYSFQSVIKPIQSVDILLGASHATPDTSVIAGGAPQAYDERGQMSYRAGVTYEYLKGASVYASYSESFNPQPLVDSSFHVIPPATGVQYEIGSKLRTNDGKLLLTAAAYQIKEDNLAQYVTTLNGVNIYQTVGQLTHRGAELQALGQLTPNWQINAGYSYVDPTITAAIATGVAPQSATVGQTQLFIPKQTASLFSTYSLQQGFLKGFSFGGGVRVIGAQHTSYGSALANTQTFTQESKDLPGYALFDLTASYTLDKWLFQVNARNIFNKTYYINNYQSLLFGNQPGAPFNVALTVRRDFKL